MSKRSKAAWILVGAVLVGAAAQKVANHEAALLGLSAFELALLGGAAGAIVIRTAL